MNVSQYIKHNIYYSMSHCARISSHKSYIQQTTTFPHIFQFSDNTNQIGKQKLQIILPRCTPMQSAMSTTTNQTNDFIIEIHQTVNEQALPEILLQFHVLNLNRHKCCGSVVGSSQDLVPPTPLSCLTTSNIVVPTQMKMQNRFTIAVSQY